MKDYLKICLLIAFVVVLVLAAKILLVPIFSDITFEKILAMPMADILKVSEFAVLFILIGTFLLHEVFQLAQQILDKRLGKESNKERFFDFVYVFVVIGGSVGLYAFAAPRLPY